MSGRSVRKPILNRLVDINKSYVSTTSYQCYKKTTLKETTLFKDLLVALRK